VYLASGWWLPGHKEALEQLEALLGKRAYEYFSPRLESQLEKNSPFKQRQEVFQRNLDAIHEASLVFARIDDYDPGTVWEMGFAFAVHTPVVAWSLVEGRGLNLMLSESCEGFLNGWFQIQEFFSETGFRMEVAEKWKNEVE
jgi:nucleoside deoxyribosyltransferase